MLNPSNQIYTMTTSREMQKFQKNTSCLILEDKLFGLQHELHDVAWNVRKAKKQIYCWIYFTCPQVYSQFCIIQMIFLTYKIWVSYAFNYLLQAENRFNSILKLHRHFRAQICTTNEYIYNIMTNVNDIFQWYWKTAYNGLNLQNVHKI